LVPVLFTFCIQGVAKLKNNSGAKRLRDVAVVEGGGGSVMWVCASLGVQSSRRCLSLQQSCVGFRLIDCPSSMSNADER
jgi:hypothetical protein